MQLGEKGQIGFGARGFFLRASFFQLMTVRILHTCVALSFWWALSGIVFAQQYPISTDRRSGDTNNAVIEGRVALPSGFAAERYLKITVRNSVSILYRIFTNKHGEFRFHDLSEGIYYVQAEVEGDDFEPAIEKVALGRGIVYELTLRLREKKGPDIRGPGGRIVSAAELHQKLPASAKKEYDAALKHVKKGDVSRAAEHFEQAIAIFPDYLAARNDLGAQYLKLKRLDEAEVHFRTVLDRDPKNLYATFNLGLGRIERRDFPGAISQLQRAITIDSAWPTPHLWLGYAMLETGDLPTAERELNKALVMGGADCVAAHYHLARAYVMRGDAQEAYRAIKAYLEEAPHGEYMKEARELAKKLGSEVKQASK
jgi:tetratricopeptide (TPR) repeat protein